MKIIYKTGPRAGQVDHVPNSQEFQVLASAGLIEIVPYKTYQERLAAEMPKATAPVVGWGVQHNATGGEQQLRSVTLIKTVNGDQTIYDAPPADCPPDVIAKFRKAVAVYEQIVQDKKHSDKVRAERMR
jgi:hypothetical protein